MEDDPQKFPDAVSAGTPVGFALGDLPVVIGPEYFIIPDNGKNDLVKGLAKILRSFLGDGGMLSLVLGRFIDIRGTAGSLDDLSGAAVVVDIS